MSGPSFRSRVAAEARATWGRFRVLWLLLAAGAALAVLLCSDLRFEGWPFRVLCIAAAWVPAWLGSDLLALRFKANPEPLREWHPAEYLARALGRLGPFSLALLLCTSIYTFRALRHEMQTGSPPLTGPAGFPGAWSGWAFVFLASGTTYFLAAALLSAVSRRPRRWVIFPFVVLLGHGVDSLFPPVMGTPRPLTVRIIESITELAIYPNLWPGVWMGGLLSEVTGADQGPGVSDFAVLCWCASAGFLILSAAGTAALWSIAARRCRRGASRT
jgi:hypothetical protein